VKDIITNFAPVLFFYFIVVLIYFNKFYSKENYFKIRFLSIVVLLVSLGTCLFFLFDKGIYKPLIYFFIGYFIFTFLIFNYNLEFICRNGKTHIHKVNLVCNIVLLSIILESKLLTSINIGGIGDIPYAFVMYILITFFLILLLRYDLENLFEKNKKTVIILFLFQLAIVLEYEYNFYVQVFSNSRTYLDINNFWSFISNIKVLNNKLFMYINLILLTILILSRYIFWKKYYNKHTDIV